MQIAVVGAGIGGLSAALQLIDDGHRVDVYEAAPAFGAVSPGARRFASLAPRQDWTSGRGRIR